MISGGPDAGESAGGRGERRKWGGGVEERGRQGREGLRAALARWVEGREDDEGLQSRDGVEDVRGLDMMQKGG